MPAVGARPAAAPPRLPPCSCPVLFFFLGGKKRPSAATARHCITLAAGRQALQDWAAAALAAPRALAGAAELHLQHLERCLVVPCQLDGCAGQPAAQTTRRFARPAPQFAPGPVLFLSIVKWPSNGPAAEYSRAFSCADDSSNTPVGADKKGSAIVLLESSRSHHLSCACISSQPFLNRWLKVLKC